MKVGLFFGSFNPVHHGHLIIANHILNFSGVDEVWFVISPQNPFKQRINLLNNYDRQFLVELAIGDNYRLKPCTVEFDMPVPSYTVDTLAYLRDKYPDHEFSIIMGSDNLVNFHRWKNFEVILKHYKILVYIRPGFENVPYMDHPAVSILKAPLLEISSSFIRKLVRENRSIMYLVPARVENEILKHNFFKT